MLSALVKDWLEQIQEQHVDGQQRDDPNHNYDDDLGAVEIILFIGFL